MRSIFLKLSATALTGLALAFGGMSASLAAQSTPAPTTAATTAVTIAQPTAQPAVATTSATQYPACPNPNATAVATSAATAVATTAATAAATAPANPNPGYLGIAAQQVQNCGAQILDVRPDSAAATAKLQIGDVVVAVNGQAITSLDQFRMIVQNHKPGDTITITYQRSGKQSDTTATLGAVPANTTATQASTAASK
ncbi:MAG: S1C family serine protease [Aggregatilineales bacterium]